MEEDTKYKSRGVLGEVGTGDWASGGNLALLGPRLASG